MIQTPLKGLFITHSSSSRVLHKETSIVFLIELEPCFSETIKEILVSFCYHRVYRLEVGQCCWARERGDGEIRILLCQLERQTSQTGVYMTNKKLGSEIYLGWWAALHVGGLEQHADARIRADDERRPALYHRDIGTIVVELLRYIVSC